MTNYVFVSVMALAALVEYMWYRRERRKRKVELMARQISEHVYSIALTPKDVLELEIMDAARRG